MPGARTRADHEFMMIMIDRDRDRERAIDSWP
jgi:hypothetical protein